MRFGVIGGGGKVGQLRVQTIHENVDTQLVAILDLSEDSARAVAGDAEVFTDLDQFLSVEMDAVIISTPPHFHEEACLKALAAGCHVLVEKPFSSSAESCRRMIDAGQKANRHVAVGFNMRYYPAFAYVKDAVTSGKIGQLTHVRAFGGHEGTVHFTHDWEYRVPMTGGGATWDIGIHVTDIVRHILGEVTSVYGVSSETVWNLEGSEDNAIAIFRNPEGIAATYQATWGDWRGYQFVIEAHGTHGMVRGSYAPMRNLLITMPEPGGKQTVTKVNYFGIEVREKLKSWKTTCTISFAEELCDFLKVCGGGTSVRSADANAGLRSIEIADAIKQSSLTNKAVELPILHPVRA
ncbi:MAG: Gfo/Idh/MocA family oxidoreductase [Paracoccaceae bacterium]|nr:Gfo/Idh/MocA family oxidoreductase [Paracoccaceae bacterium]